jgi:PAS domain S-box-containing protein
MPAWWTWFTVGDIAVPKLMAPESLALIILIASLLVFRTFRERYLLVWIVGWMAYFGSRWTLRDGGHHVANYLVAISHAQFILAVCLFAAAVLVYTHSRKFLLPFLLVATAVISYAVVRALWWPDLTVLRVALEVSYRLIALAAAVQLLRFRWARWEIGPWLLSISLLWLHLDWAPVNFYLPPGLTPAADLLFSLGILLIVFDESKGRTRRLCAINSLMTSIAAAQQHAPMLVTALEQLKRLTRSNAAWIYLSEGDELVIAQHIGLSEEFVQNKDLSFVNATLQSVLREGKPTVIKLSTADESMREHFESEQFHHLVVVPVRGKKSSIGILMFGRRHTIFYTLEEMEFLATCAQQLGFAVENVRLLEQILRAQRQWTNTFDSIQDFVLLHDSQFRVVKANHALLQRLGRAPADVVGKLCESVLPRTGEAWAACPYCRKDDEGYHEGVDPCFGGFSMVSTSSFTDQGSRQRGTIHVIRDSTDGRMAQVKYRLLFEQVQEGVFVATHDGKLLDCNDAFMRMLGHNNREELMSLNIDTELYVSVEQRDAFRREVELNNYVRNFEVTLRRKDGVLLTAMESSFATRDARGKIERYQGFLLDMTEKKHAEDEIRRRNRELNALNAMAVIATQSFDLDEILNLTLRQVISLLGAETGSIYLCETEEPTFRRRAGWGQRSADRARLSEIKLPDGFGDLVTRSRTEVITPEYLPHLPPSLADFIRADGLRSWIWVLLWSKDKPVGIMGISSRETRVYTNNDENLLVAIGRQLSTTIEKVRLYEETCRAYEELRTAQEQLLQSEKMSAVGQLIAGVAHELNNPLTAILGYAQLLEGEGLEERASDFVRKLFKQAQRTHRVVQNLLSFARQRKPQKQEVDIRKVLDETLALRDYDLKVNNITLEREIEPAISAVTADPHQLEQVFLNIINNAVDALLEAGKGGTLKVCIYAKDGNVHAEFHDSGGGIKEPNRIFDPFYTTKSVGKGTGLGLSICYGIVKEHGGDISARNRPEGGAIIEVRLPSAGRTPTPEQNLPVSRHELAIEGRILLVEDEEAVLEFERDVLTGAGAQVVTLMNGEDMKAHLRAEIFDALIVNGKMPGGWSAEDVYRWIVENRPELEKHTLFTFSSVLEPEMRLFLQEKSLPYLAKPFEVAELIAQARRLSQKTRAATAG